MIDLVGCADGCGRSATQQDAESGGWSFLPIQGRWRCPDCAYALAQANQSGGARPEDARAAGETS
jgi:hypothetical protein